MQRAAGMRLCDQILGWRAADCNGKGNAEGEPASYVCNCMSFLLHLPNPHLQATDLLDHQAGTRGGPAF